MKSALSLHSVGVAMPFPRFRDLLTMAELAAYLHKSSGEAARKWARRHDLPMTKVGREWRVDPRDVDRKLTKDTQASIAYRVETGR